MFTIPTATLSIYAKISYIYLYSKRRIDVIPFCFGPRILARVSVSSLFPTASHVRQRRAETGRKSAPVHFLDAFPTTLTVATPAISTNAAGVRLRVLDTRTRACSVL